MTGAPDHSMIHNLKNMPSPTCQGFNATPFHFVMCIALVADLRR